MEYKSIYNICHYTSWSGVMRFIRRLYRDIYQISIIIVLCIILFFLLFLLSSLLLSHWGFQNTLKFNSSDYLFQTLNWMIVSDDYERVSEIVRVNGNLYWTLSRRSTRVNCVSRISTSCKKDGTGGQTCLRETTLSSTEEREEIPFF